MAAATRFLASAAVGSLMVVCIPVSTLAQVERAPAPVLPRTAPFSPGSIAGTVQDEHGVPISGVVVSVVGGSTTIAVTDKTGHFELASLTPGPYSVRAHLSGYLTPRAQTIQVPPGARATSSIAMRRVGSEPLAAGVGLGADDPRTPDKAAADGSTQPDPGDDHGETAWRLRHSRRSVLKEVEIPAELLVDDNDSGHPLPGDFLGRMSSQARAATSFFADTPFSGQVNLLTTTSFDSPQQLLSTDVLSLAHSATYVQLGAPVGDQANWSVRGAMTEADISSWIVAGSYTSHQATRHRYDVGLSYSTQRYGGGNVLAMRDVPDGSRNAGTLSAYDTFSVTPALTLAYGGSYAHYDYLDNRTLLSPRFELTLVPLDGLRLKGSFTQRGLAPGAEEFLPPGDAGIWLPPQRTFSSINPGAVFTAENTTHAQVAAEHDFGLSTVSVRAFRQHVDDQLVTLFGAEMPGEPTTKIGHYMVGNVGDLDASGCAAGLRTVLANRVRGSIEYTMTRADMLPQGDMRYLLLLAPSAIRTTERLHDISTALEADVPETATRVLVLYRVGNGYVHPRTAVNDNPGMDARFDVQVRQQLPFMNFSNARWEMLVAVRNFFRDPGPEQSMYDELLVVRPPKRVVGGVTLRF